MSPPIRSRRLVARAVVLVVILGAVVPAAVSAVTYEGTHSILHPGTIDQPADGLTIVAVQGFHFQGQGATKKPARLVAFGPRGDVRWVLNGSRVGARWFYDVDPLPTGNVMVTATNPDGTIVYAVDPVTLERVWVERLDAKDTHDVDLINGDQLLVANMRNYNESSEVNEDRLFIYDRGTDEIVWEWHFDPRYPSDEGGIYTDDWTHVNDVDKVGPGKFLASVRNFDQVILVDRSSGEIELQLGENEAHDVIYEQHNPQYLESEDGRATILVADSENARIVEYERRDQGWHRTWSLGGADTFSWPRDADRLPSGNTLIVDSLNHRVIEVTPRGRIVWEAYAPWATYDVERVPIGDEGQAVDSLATMADRGVSGHHNVSNSAGLVPGTADRVTFAQRLIRTFSGTVIEPQARWFALRWAHIAPWIYPVWMTGWDFVGLVAAVILLLGWAAGELFVDRRRVVAAARRRYRHWVS